MTLPVEPPLTPMLSRLEPELPSGPGWLFEPKWDGFRALVFRDGDRLRLVSRNGQPLERYFPELVANLAEALPQKCVVDGEIIVEIDGSLDFDALLQRIHPAASRIERLSRETPARFAAFDVLALGPQDLRRRPFKERRAALTEALGTSRRRAAVFATAQTPRRDIAERWFRELEQKGLDGIVAKRADSTYQPGERVMVKVKHARTADCVVGGFRRKSSGKGLASLLLGLYDRDGVLQYVGHTSAFPARQQREVEELLTPIAGKPSFGEGRAPGGPSRWSRGREVAWESVDPVLVCEVAYDKVQGDRFRHAAQFLRWRPDKRPEECSWEREFGRRAASWTSDLGTAQAP